MESQVKYWRHPTQEEIRCGQGYVRWIVVDLSQVIKLDGTLKKWFIGKDGLRYNRP